jgi:hypothetical protein
MAPWFEALFGFREGCNYEANRDAFALSSDGLTLFCDSAPAVSKRMHVGPFETPSLAELRERCGQMPLDIPRTRDTCAGQSGADKGGLRFQHLATPVGVSSLIADPANAGAVFQAASQFNCLEMTGPGVSPRQGITSYSNDPTQGPKCALACPAGTVFRNYFSGRNYLGQGREQIDCLADVGRVVGNVKDRIWTMKNGYALPTSAYSMRDLGHRLHEDGDLARRAEEALRVGVHWDTSVKPPATHCVAQVYASALPVAYAKQVKSEDWQPFACLVLRAAYEATLAVGACLSQRQGGRRVKVFLTVLGGGAFGNRPEWIRKAISHALEVHRESPLDVVLVHYGSTVKGAYKTLRTRHCPP